MTKFVVHDHEHAHDLDHPHAFGSSVRVKHKHPHRHKAGSIESTYGPTAYHRRSHHHTAQEREDLRRQAGGQG